MIDHSALIADLAPHLPPDLFARTVAALTGKPKRERVNVGEHPDFAALWVIWPKRPGNSRKEACERFTRLVAGGEHPAAIIAAARRYADYCTAEAVEPRYIKHTVHWLNQRGWENDYTVRPSAAASSTNARAAVALGNLRDGGRAPCALPAPRAGNCGSAEVGNRGDQRGTGLFG